MTQYSREVLEAPQSVVNDGRCSMGTYNSVINNLNLLEAENPLGIPYPRFFNNFRLKEWQAFQISNEDYFICIAISNIKFIATSLLFIYEKKSNRIFQYMTMGFPGSAEVPNGLNQSMSICKSENLNITFINRLDTQHFEIEFSAAGQKGNPSCSGRFSAIHDSEPIVIIHPFGDNRPLYSHKALMSGKGQLSIGDRHRDFSENQTLLIVDDHKGFYPYHLRYDWLTAMGYSRDIPIGFNLTCNQILEPEKYNENCLWLEKKMIPLPPIKVKRPQGLEKQWIITDDYGRVNLKFTPGNAVFMKKGIWPLSLFYYGPFGKLEGHIVDEKGNPVDFTDFTAMGEKRSDWM